MDDEFWNVLLEFLKKINKLIEDDKNIVLDKTLFIFDKDTGKYSLNDNAIEIINNTKILFIGDNPGENEKKNHEYFYNPDSSQDKIYYSRAGYKLHKNISKINDIEGSYVLFNKSLISTNKTSDLSKYDINHGTFKNVEECVIEFIENFMDHNHNVVVVFLGYSKNKSHPLYNVMKKINDRYKERVFFSPHPVRGMFKYKDEKVNFYDNTTPLSEYLTFLKKIKEYIWPQDDDGDDDDGDDGDGDDGDGNPPLVPVLN